MFVTNIESVFVSVYQSSLNQFHIATIRFFESLFFFFSFFFFFLLLLLQVLCAFSISIFICSVWLTRKCRKPKNKTIFFFVWNLRLFFSPVVWELRKARRKSLSELSSGIWYYSTFFFFFLRKKISCLPNRN